MRYSFRILFFPRKKPSQKDERSMLYIRVTINAKPIEFSSKIKIDSALWDQQSQRMLGKTRESLDINNALLKISARLNKLYNELKEEEKDIPTPERLKEAFFGGNSLSKKYLLLTIFDKLISQKQELAESGVINEGSANTYACTKEKLVSYMKIYYPQLQLDIRRIDYEFINGFEIYLKSKEECGHNTMIRHMRHLKQVTTYAYKNGYLSKDPFYNVTLSAKKVERVFLTETELKRLITIGFINENLRKVRDIFIFCCFTGLSYIDVKQLKYRDIVDEAIVIHRQKTGNKSFIPILQIPRMLIDKYRISKEPNGLVFPVYTSQRMNASLKIIGELTEINKTLTMHVARHTFATLLLSKGASIESISKILGHTELKTTMIYAKILDDKVIEDAKYVDKQLTDLTDILRERLKKSN